VLHWYGAEEPDPLANYTGSHIVGPPIYLVCGNEPRLSVRLSRPNGTVIPLLATTPIQSKQASKSFDFGNGCASSSPVLWTLFPASKLAKGTRYSLRFTTTTRTRTVAFTTSDWTVRISTGRVRRTAVARVRVTVRSDTRFTLLVHVTRSVGKRTSFLHSWRFAEPAGTTTLRAQDLIGTRALAAAYRLSFSDASEPTRVKTIRLTVTE
jgi:hypothetical protein